jgi:hypothetical protein
MSVNYKSILRRIPPIFFAAIYPEHFINTPSSSHEIFSVSPLRPDMRIISSMRANVALMSSSHRP